MIYSFGFEHTTIKQPKVSKVGGKGKALIELSLHNFPIPEGFVLSTDFFTPWIKEITSTDEWKNLLLSISENNSRKVMEIAADLKMNSVQKEKLHDSLRPFHKNELFAIRSSSPEEDLKKASFAGLYETKLGVLRSSIERTIAEIFSSLFSIRLLCYKLEQGFSIDKPSIAIVVQKQLRADVSGVSFSLNPINNCYDEVMINATFGLGESLVSGKVTPDIYVVDVLKNEIIEYKIGRKEVGIWFGSKGNTEEVRVRNPKVPALRKLEIIHVSEMCKRCEQYFGFPVDIEFAFENSTLYLLQARAITTYFPLYDEYKTTPGKPKHLYLDLIKLSQGFQDSLSELGNEIFTKMVVEVKQGFITEGKEGIMYSVAGREYLDLTNLCSAIGETLLKKTIASYDKPTREILSKIQFSKQYKNEKKPDNIRGVRASLFKTGITAFPLLCSPNINPSSIISDYFEAADLCFIDFDQITEKEMYLDKMVNESLKRFGYLMKRLVALFGAIIAENKIKKIFKNYPVSDEIISLHIDLPGNPTSDMGKQMLHIASNKEFQAVETFEEFQTKLAENSFSRAFIRDYDRYMKLYGCRCVGEIDIATPRIYEQPGLFYQTLKSINIHDNAIDKARDKKRDALIKLSALSKKIGKEKQFIKAYNMLTILGIREHPKYMFVYAIDKIRQKVLNIGTQMLVNRQINNVNDIFMLSISDITRAQKDRSLKMQKIVRENKEKRTLTEHVKDWPVIVDSRGKIYRYSPEETSGKFIGDPVAPGYAKGIAKVLHSPFEKKIQPGDILVVKQTEPSWTPAFINAAGVVMEIGGALQHGAIIAREYGIPCVTGIDGATLLIQDGDMIEVDGSNGTVKKSTT